MPLRADTLGEGELGRQLAARDGNDDGGGTGAVSASGFMLKSVTRSQPPKSTDLSNGSAATSITSDRTAWVIDTGATAPMTGDPSLLTRIVPSIGIDVTTANGTVSRGDTTGSRGDLTGINIVDGLAANLLSTGTEVDKNNSAQLFTEDSRSRG